ncbi:hypothetical protein [Amycolatopsis pithecellobii]|uniref:hypothetical protein n=1 Tax=Amycolatopsis pithecellobii TaxID=664692 RepID=UPI001AA06722|nr:hypothetical protein [Amycolatopsis pithecellobii]
MAQAKRMVSDYGFSSFKLNGGVFEPAQEIAAARALEDVLEYLEDPTTGTANMAEVVRT